MRVRYEVWQERKKCVSSRGSVENNVLSLLRKDFLNILYLELRVTHRSVIWRQNQDERPKYSTHKVTDKRW